MGPAIAAPRESPAATRLAALAGLAAMICPTIITIASDRWATPEGAQGPIILATGTWLFWRARGTLRRDAAPATGALWPLAFVPPALLWAFGRAYGVLPLEAAAAYLAFLLAALTYLGPGLVRRFWFPFLYIGFLVPPPATVLAGLTQPLKLWISAVSVSILHGFDLPVALSGAAIQIAQYELMVRTACAGLGSMVTLCAVGLFYVHLRRNAGVRYGGTLLLAVVPLAILANLVRVIVLVLLTWYAGSAVAQGVAHDLAGFLMFTVAMLGLFAIDAALSAAFAGKRRGAA